jgi:hypothetical protein
MRPRVACPCGLSAIVALLAFGPAADAELIVNWGGDYVSAAQNSPRGTSNGTAPFDTDDDVNDGLRNSYPFDLDAALNPAIGGDYSGPSARFYGGHADAREAGAWYFGVQQQVSVQDRIGGDTIRLAATANEGGNHFLASYLVWKKEDFLGGAASADVGFDAASDWRIDRITLTLADVEKPDGYHTLRWWACSGGSCFVSDDVTGGDNLADDTACGTTDFSTLLWTASLVADGSFDRMYVNSGTFDTASSALSDITAVGFVVQGYGSSGAASDRMLQYHEVSSFEVSAVPEPATFAVLAAGLLALSRRRRGTRHPRA